MLGAIALVPDVTSPEMRPDMPAGWRAIFVFILGDLADLQCRDILVFLFADTKLGQFVSPCLFDNVSR